MKKMIIAYRALEALGFGLFLTGIVNLALDYQLDGFQLMSVLFTTGGLALTFFASIMVDHAKIVARTEEYRRTNEEIDARLENKIALGKLKSEIIASIIDEFMMEADNDEGVQCLLTHVADRFDAYINANNK